jgi:hypothetical protein
MNKLLQQTVQATLQKAKPQYVAAINKVVLAGKKVMYSPQSREMAMGELKKANGNPEAIGAAVAKLVAILMAHAKGTMPPEVFVPAGTILMCEALQFMEDAGTLTVSADFLAQCTKAMGSALLQMLGITPEKMQQLVAQKQGQPAQTAQPAQPAQPAAQPAQPGVVGGAMQ